MGAAGGEEVRGCVSGGCTQVLQPAVLTCLLLSVRPADPTCWSPAWLRLPSFVHVHPVPRASGL